MSDLDFINFLMIDDVGRSTKNNEKLNDLRDRAAFIAKKTGKEPESFYEFQQTAPKEEPHTLRNLSIGAAIGAGIGAALLNPMLALSLGFIGGAIGGFSDTQNTRRNKLVSKYEAYLNKFEQSASPAHGYTVDHMPPLREGEQVEKLREGALSQVQQGAPIIHS